MLKPSEGLPRMTTGNETSPNPDRGAAPVADQVPFFRPLPPYDRYPLMTVAPLQGLVYLNAGNVCEISSKALFVSSVDPSAVQ
jgi:hypothetical protein